MISQKIMSVVITVAVAILSSLGIAAAGLATSGSNVNSPSVLYFPNSSGTLEVIFTDGRFFDSPTRSSRIWEQMAAPASPVINQMTAGPSPLLLSRLYLRPRRVSTRCLTLLTGLIRPTQTFQRLLRGKPQAACCSIKLSFGWVYRFPQARSLRLRQLMIPMDLPAPASYRYFGGRCRQQTFIFSRGVMIDARESTGPITKTLNTTDESLYLSNLIFDLKHQADDATLGHAQASQSLSDTTLGQIVDFELHIFTAQQKSATAGSLEVKGATGGPLDLSMERFYVTINDVLGADKFGNPFDSSAFTLFNTWANSNSSARAQIFRGQQLFNNRQFDITGVGGINDDLQIPSLHGTCTTCHDSPNVGNHSVPLPINIGTSDGSRRTPDLPLYTLENKITHETVQTTDPAARSSADSGKTSASSKGPYFVASRPGRLTFTMVQRPLSKMS